MAKILVVDDEPDMIWAITNVLLTGNHSVISVNSGEDALKKVQEVNLDLALLDFRLPGMDGIQILERIKQIKPELPVIMVTGYGGIEEAVQSIKLGAAHYIAKPFDNDHLMEVVNKSLKLNSLKKEGVFGKRVVEKISPKAQEPRSETLSSRGMDVPKGKGRMALVLGGLLLMSGLLAAGLWHRSRSQDHSYLISETRVSGLSWEGQKLWTCDWFTQSVHQYELTKDALLVAKTYPLTGYHLTGIAAGGEFIYTCDSWKRTITKHALNDNLTVISSVTSPGPNPSGLFYDGQNLWSCDGNTRKIYQHALDDRLTVINSFDSKSSFPVGLYKEDKYLWYAGVKGMVYKHDVAGAFKLEKAYLLPEQVSDQHPTSAFALRQNKIWVAYEGVNKLFEIDLSHLKETQF